MQVAPIDGQKEPLDEFTIMAGSEAVFDSVKDEVLGLKEQNIIETFTSDDETLEITFQVRESCMKHLPPTLRILLPQGKLFDH